MSDNSFVEQNFVLLVYVIVMEDYANLLLQANIKAVKFRIKAFLNYHYKIEKPYNPH